MKMIINEEKIYIFLLKTVKYFYLSSCLKIKTIGFVHSTVEFLYNLKTSVKETNIKRKFAQAKNNHSHNFFERKMLLK